MKLPTIDERAIPTPASPGNVGVVQADTSQMAKATQQLGNELINTGALIYEAKDNIDKFNYATAKSSFLRQNIELENKISKDPDYANIGTKYKDEVAKIKTDTLGGLKNSRWAQHLSNEMGVYESRSISQLDSIAEKRQNEVARGSLIDTIDSNQKYLLQTANETQRSALIHSTNDAIQSALDTGAINEEGAIKLRTGFAGGYAENRLSLLTPYQQINALSPKIGKNGEVFFPKKNNYVDFLSADKKVQFYQQAQSEIKAAKTKEIDTTMVNLALEGKVVLDPTSNQNQKAIDVVWGDRQNNLMGQGASKEQILNSSLDMVTKTGMMPTPIKSVLTANITNGNVEQKATYSKYIGDAANLNPKVLNGLDKEVVGTAIAISNNLRSGLSAQQAVEWVNKYQDQAKKESIESKKNAWENLNKKSFKDNDKQIFNLLADEPGIDFYKKAPEVPQAMIDDYKRLSKGFFVSDNLDNTSANSVAEKMVRAQWGVTEIGGQKKYMKYAPEVIYGNEDNWVHKQLAAEFGNETVPFEQPKRTKLSPTEEAQFQAWYKQQAINTKTDTNPDDPRHFYDFRGAWKAGETLDKTGHWSSQFKDANHPRRFVVEDGSLIDTKIDYDKNNKVNPSDIVKNLALEVDYSTIQTPNPSYFVFKKDSYGSPQVILGEDNLPKKFTPNYRKADTQKIKEDLKNAQADREKMMIDQEIREKLPLGR